MNENRILSLDGVHNFRAFGGYAVEGGGRVRRGLLWRSAEHAGASDTDLGVIAGLGLSVVADLRGTSERSARPCRRPAGFAAEVMFYDGETAQLGLHIEAAKGPLDADSARAAMTGLYKVIAWRSSLLPTFRRYFGALAVQDGASLVHCVAGKDRTGFAVAVLQHALGVHHDDIMADYLLTNADRNLESRIAALASASNAGGFYGTIDETAMRQLLGVQPAYLEAAFAAVAERHGTIERYLAGVLGVGAKLREVLRARFVEAR